MKERKRQPRRPRQLGLEFRTRGGARKGAGRKPKGPRAGVSHLRRPALAARFPVHVTLRVAPHVWNLRSRRAFRYIGAAFRAASERFGTRLCEFSVQGNHIHLLVEATGQPALSHAMQGLCIRIARGLNRLMNRRSGRVFADRYHAHILRTPTEARRARAYVRSNSGKHANDFGKPLPRGWVDPYSSASREHGIALAAPHTWLLSKGFARGSPATQLTRRPTRTPS